MLELLLAVPFISIRMYIGSSDLPMFMPSDCDRSPGPVEGELFGDGSFGQVM